MITTDDILYGRVSERYAVVSLARAEALPDNYQTVIRPPVGCKVTEHTTKTGFSVLQSTFEICEPPYEDMLCDYTLSLAPYSEHLRSAGKILMGTGEILSLYLDNPRPVTAVLSEALASGEYEARVSPLPPKIVNRHGIRGRVAELLDRC